MLWRLIAPLLLVFSIQCAGQGMAQGPVPAATSTAAAGVVDESAEVARNTMSRRQAVRSMARLIRRRAVRAVWRAPRALGAHVMRSTRLAPPARRGPPILLL